MPRRPVDLHDLLDDVCERYLGRTLDVEIQWGDLQKIWPSSPYRTYACCFLDEDECSIVLDESLQAAWVPRYFLAYLVWHEACHAVLHERTGDLHAGHGPAFTLLERTNPTIDRALAWESKHSERLTDLLDRVEP